jgi:hypothetical protein
LLSQVNDAKEIAKRADEKRKADVAQRTKQLQEVVSRNKELATQVEGLTRATFEVPSGKIEWVDQRTKTVWINLGRSDNLKQLTTFSVYESQTMDVSNSEKKASIEVTELLGPHQAAARISDDMIGNPILVGDVVYTPLWQPGEKKRFAITGLVDIDDDGKSDLKVLMSVIESSGGIVDSYRDESGLHGKITSQTGYLLVGVPPTEKSTQEELHDYHAQLKAARMFSLKEVTVREFLNMMGYKPDRRVQQFGADADPNQFQAKQKPGAAKVSSGKVSKLYDKDKEAGKDRKPPRVTPADANQ